MDATVVSTAARALGRTAFAGVVLVSAGVLLAAGPQGTPARRLQVERDAIAALENLSPFAGPSPAAFDKLASLGEPTPFEHLWVLASVAAWERTVSHGNYPVLLEEAVDRGLRRFPRDSRLLLARLLARPEALAISNRPGVPPERLARFRAWGMVRLVPLQTAGRSPGFVPNPKTIPLTRDGFRALANDPAVGDEARARLALLEYLLGDLDASLSDVAGASDSTDPFIRNLAGVVAGLAWDAKGQPDRALAAYRTAVEAMPQSTAAVAFATHAFLAGHRADADHALAEALPPRPFVIDPWDGLGADDRFSPRYLADLRAMAGLPPRADGAPPMTPIAGFEITSGRAGPAIIRPQIATPMRVQPLLRVFVPALPAGAAAAPLPPRPAGASPPAAKTDPRTFRSTTTMVLVDASVQLNKRPVAGLTAGDFQILDNGVPQTVEAVSVEPIPLDVSIVIDTAESTTVGASGVVHDSFADAVPRFADVLGALRPDDRVRVIEANLRSVELLPWTFMRDLAGRTLTLNSVPPAFWGLPSAICDATAAALMHPAPVNRRSLVLVLTDGIDGMSLTTPAELGRVAQLSDGTIILVRHDTRYEQRLGRWMAGMAQQRPGAPQPVDHENEELLWPKDIDGFERAVRDSGGYVFQVGDGTTSASRIRDVLADFAQRYLLRYTAQGVAPDGWHAVAVGVKRPGNYIIQARRGYFGG